MPPEDVKKERRDSQHKGKRRKTGTVKELKGNGSGPKGRQNHLSFVHISVDNIPLWGKGYKPILVTQLKTKNILEVIFLL